MTAYRFLIAAAAGLLMLSGVACVQGQRATDLADPGFPFGPTSLSTRPVAFVQDIKPIFDRDCSECHGAREARGDYSIATYAGAMRGQRPGDARSSVVVDCSPGGSMYQYFRGDAVTEATMVFRWMVVYDGLESR